MKIIVAAIVLFLLFILWWSPVLFSILLVIAFVAAIFIVPPFIGPPSEPTSQSGRGLQWRPGVVVTGMAPAQALDLVVPHMVSRGYVLESHQGNSATFSYHEEPSTAVGIFLLLFGLLPGLLYFLLAGRDRRTTLLATEEADGCRLYISGDAGPAQQELHDWVWSLPGSVFPTDTGVAAGS
jgi:hypothetical protein